MERKISVLYLWNLEKFTSKQQGLLQEIYESQADMPEVITMTQQCVILRPGTKRIRVFFGALMLGEGMFRLGLIPECGEIDTSDTEIIISDTKVWIGEKHPLDDPDPAIWAVSYSE